MVVLAPIPAEKSAYALARYSRSSDSVARSLQWVRERGSDKFLDTFYFRYGHASIADLGHLAFCFEGVSELAAIEIEDEQLWDGQAKSSRYQDFSKGNVIIPKELRDTSVRETYETAAAGLLSTYSELHAELRAHLRKTLPKPPSMKPVAYRRTIDARAFDVARYLLFAGISTNVGQVTSIRTLEKQMRRLGVSEYGEVRSIAREMHDACAAPPACGLDDDLPQEPVAPTLAKYADPDHVQRKALGRVRAWAQQNFRPAAYEPPQIPRNSVDLVQPTDPLTETAATWLYAVTSYPFRVIYETVSEWSRKRQLEVLETALKSRGARDDLMRPFHGGYALVFDIVCDLGAYRDLHRHRRCQQIRQKFEGNLGHEVPRTLCDAGLVETYKSALRMAKDARLAVRAVSEPASQYLLPFAARVRSLFKMDFAEAEYIARVRSGVKGHFSYRSIVWEMRERMVEAHPELATLMQATPPWVQDDLTR